MRPLLLTIFAVTIFAGCAPREQAFDCVQTGANPNHDELVMTPTSARFQSVRYAFKNESGALRTYAQKETGRILEFNPASGLLRANDQDWICKKYSLEVESKSRN